MVRNSAIPDLSKCGLLVSVMTLTIIELAPLPYSNVKLYKIPEAII